MNENSHKYVYSMKNYDFLIVFPCQNVIIAGKYHYSLSNHDLHTRANILRRIYNWYGLH